jgi:hypothetical protein
MKVKFTKKKDKTLLFRKRYIVEPALHVKKKWGTIYGTLGMRYGRKGYPEGGIRP